MDLNKAHLWTENVMLICRCSWWGEDEAPIKFCDRVHKMLNNASLINTVNTD